MGRSVITRMWRFPSDTQTELHFTSITLSLKLPITGGFYLMGTITEAVVERWETDDFVKELLTWVLLLLCPQTEQKKVLHIKMAKRRLGWRTALCGWLAEITLYTQSRCNKALVPLFCILFATSTASYHTPIFITPTAINAPRVLFSLLLSV